MWVDLISYCDKSNFKTGLKLKQCLLEQSPIAQQEAHVTSPESNSLLTSQ